jgi:valyl-tRNA synthetase
MAGFINKEEETARLNREIAKLQKDLIAIENKLVNPQFVDKAPADVVAKERAKQADIAATLAKLTNQLGQL